MLCRLRFDDLPDSWAIALKMAHEYLPSDGVTYEHRYNAMMERRLLAILLLAAERDGRKDFAYIQEMAQKLDDSPAIFAKTLRHPKEPDANLALEGVLKSVGSLFCEPTKQLLLSLKNARCSCQPSTALRDLCIRGAACPLPFGHSPGDIWGKMKGGNHAH